MHAAGGTISTVNDLARWLIASLNDGAIDNTQPLSPFAFQQAHAPQINMDWTYYKFQRFAHGFGHYSATYEEDLLMHHFGGETHLSFMPEHGIGVAVLSNQIQGGAITTHRVAALIYDHLLDKGNMDERWATAIAEIREGFASLKARKTDRVQQLKRSVPDSVTMIDVSDLPGRYRSDRLGDIVLSVEDGRIFMQFGALSGTLEHVTGDAYLADFDPWGEPPELFVFRRDRQAGHIVLDWGGRLFAART
jgi:hypothetical protein